jgi:hypothetical protein
VPAAAVVAEVAESGVALSEVEPSVAAPGQQESSRQ